MHAAPTSEPRPATALLGGPWRGLDQGHLPVLDGLSVEDQRPNPGEVSASEMSVRRRQWPYDRLERPRR
jgi:hypothetical protein